MPVSNLLQRVNKGVLLFVVLFLVLGLQIWQILKPPTILTQTSAVPLASATPVDIFSSQEATIRGKITKITGQKLTITNTQNVTGEFDAGRIVLINDSTNLQVASSSAELQKIPLNRELVINLLYIDGRYVVTSLTFR